MNFLATSGRCVFQYSFCRSFSCITTLNTKEWRISKGLSENKTAEGILTEGPDYTFLDGRPTPLLHKQKLRVMQQRRNATKIVDFISELDFAKERHQKMLQEAADERQRLIDGRLKPKGKSLVGKN